MMLMVTPCTDWYLVFTSIARGNVPLSASILPMNLMLQLLLLPVYLLVFSGTVGTFDLSSLAESVLLVLALPFGLALLTRALLRRRPAWLERGITPFLLKPSCGFCRWPLRPCLRRRVRSCLPIWRRCTFCWCRCCCFCRQLHRWRTCQQAARVLLRGLGQLAPDDPCPQFAGGVGHCRHGISGRAAGGAGARCRAAY